MNYTADFPEHELEFLPKTQRHAAHIGSMFYYTKSTCRKGHTGLKYTKGGNCAYCIREVKGNLNENQRYRSQENIRLSIEAAKLGRNMYVPENPCKHGHRLRFVSSNNCVECHELQTSLRKEKLKYRRLFIEYGLTKEAYHDMIIAQNKKCSICEDTFTDINIHVDHCHNSGKIRGLLCNKCNQAIGLLRHSDDLIRKAADYCEYHANNPS